MIWPLWRFGVKEICLGCFSRLGGLLTIFCWCGMHLSWRCWIGAFSIFIRCKLVDGFFSWGHGRTLYSKVMRNNRGKGCTLQKIKFKIINFWIRGNYVILAKFGKITQYSCHALENYEILQESSALQKLSLFKILANMDVIWLVIY